MEMPGCEAASPALEASLGPRDPWGLWWASVAPTHSHATESWQLLSGPACGDGHRMQTGRRAHGGCGKLCSVHVRPPGEASPWALRLCSGLPGA